MRGASPLASSKGAGGKLEGWWHKGDRSPGRWAFWGKGTGVWSGITGRGSRDHQSQLALDGENLSPNPFSLESPAGATTANAS